MTDDKGPPPLFEGLGARAGRRFLHGPWSRTTELVRAFRIFGEFIRGFRALHFLGPCATVFGSARFPEGHRHYELARTMGRRLAEAGFVVMTGGGPGIMEAANRGASEARGVNIGLNISLPFEQEENPWITRRLAFEFHYFFMRKYWFAYLAKAIIAMPGGFGTLDEFMEIVTLVQTFKIKKKLPIVLFGTKFWSEVLDFAPMVRWGTISPEDLDLFHRTDSVDEAFDFVTSELEKHVLSRPGHAASSPDVTPEADIEGHVGPATAS